MTKACGALLLKSVKNRQTNLVKTEAGFLNYFIHEWIGFFESATQ